MINILFLLAIGTFAAAFTVGLATYNSVALAVSVPLGLLALALTLLL